MPTPLASLAHLSHSQVDFAKIDRDGSGFVRFDEFADWALRNR